MEDVAVPGRSQAGLEVPHSQQAACCRALGWFPGTQGVCTHWPHTFNVPRYIALPKGTLQHMCQGVFKQPHAPGPRSEPAELSQTANRIFPSQAGSPRMLGASIWLLKHSYTGSSSPRDVAAYCNKTSVEPQQRFYGKLEYFLCFNTGGKEFPLFIWTNKI